MATGIWSGNVSFGLVTLPVQLQPAHSRSRTTLTLLHEKDHAPLRRRMVCPKDDQVVEREDQVRGFPVSEGDYVVVTDEEIESLAPERSQALEIQEFVELDDIDPLFFHRSYYLTPRKGARRPYGLLVRVLEESEMAGIARFVLKDREHLAALWAMEGALCLTTLHFERQRVSREGLSPENTRVSHDKLDELVVYIEKNTETFDAARYEDENELRLLKLIRKKFKKEGVEKSPEAESRRAVPKKRVRRQIKGAVETMRGEE